MTKKPNILFFFTDDQRFDTINALDNKAIKTENIDRLVKNGTAFTRAHIPGGTVGAVCMPSRAMLHTGRGLFDVHDNGSSIPDKHTLLGETLQAAGYRTFGTGKWHNGPASYARSFSDGDNIFFGGMDDHWNVPVSRFDPSGQYDNEKNRTIDPFSTNHMVRNHCDSITPGKHSTDLFCDSAVDWLMDYESEDPFFMYISFMAPHDPRTMPKEFLDMYHPDDIQLPDNFMSEHPFDYGISTVRDEILEKYPRKEKEIRRHIAEYYAMISHLDSRIGNVMAALKKTGKYDDTIIVFSGDNGLALGQHGLMGKQSTYEHSVRVPLIFSGPGLPKNAICDSYVFLYDIFPTLCEMTGIEPPASVNGTSFYNCFKDADPKTRDSLYLAYGSLIRAFKDERYKLIEYRNEGLCRTQLFDLKKDPHETKNLYDTAGYEKTVEDLRSRLISASIESRDREHPTGKRFWDRY